MITVYGASDDLIEIEGDIREEFTYHDEDQGDLLAFSDGTVLRIKFDNDGNWRITRLAVGTLPFTLEQTTADSDDGYSGDRATLDGEIRWVVHGLSMLTKR